MSGLVPGIHVLVTSQSAKRISSTCHHRACPGDPAWWGTALL